jgi:archaellum component FlaC
MSRYATLTHTARSVLALIQPHSSMRPISQGDIGAQARTIAPPDEIHDALEQLIDARLITSMRHTVGGVTQNVYWPTGLHPITAPSMEQIHMASEAKNSQLARMILKYGPISGADLAAKATAAGLNIPTKNVQGILGGHIGRGEIIQKKRDGANWYMTSNQAAEWQENVAAAGGDCDNRAAAHVMSAPDADDEAMPEPDARMLALANRELGNQLDTANRTIDTLTDKIGDFESTIIKQRTLINDKNEQIEKLGISVHDLKNDVSAANLIFQQLCTELNLKKAEEIPGAIDELMRAVCNSDNRIQQPGRLALLLIDSAELTELEELDANCDPRIAQAAAMARIDQGHAARAVVVRIIGEAVRQAEWKEAA